MFRELELVCNVTIPTSDWDDNELIRQRSYVARYLLKYLLYVKFTKDHGYFLTVTNVKGIGKGKTHESHDSVLLPVIFTCRTFMPCVGETMLGVVHWIHERGAFLRCGPMRRIFIAHQKMADYQNFIPGENAAFLNDSLSRIEVGVVVRFTVLAVRCVEQSWRTREFQVLATLEGDSLGPVSLSGSDELAL